MTITIQDGPDYVSWTLEDDWGHKINGGMVSTTLNAAAWSEAFAYANEARRAEEERTSQ
jgi:hypothetical protein